MNHKQLAEDAYDVAINATNSGIEARYMARATYYLAMAQLEAVETLTALLNIYHSPERILTGSISADELKKELGL